MSQEVLAGSFVQIEHRLLMSLTQNRVMVSGLRKSRGGVQGYEGALGIYLRPEILGRKALER